MEEGSPAAALPDDLVVEVLARLPARSLCRFRCVSRSWRALISDPAHRRRLAQTLSGVLFSRPYGCRSRWGFAAGVSSTPPPPPPPPGSADTAPLPSLPPSCRETELVDSRHGLLLLLLRRRSPSDQPPCYLVCNPATGERVALPQPRHAPGQDGYDVELTADINTRAAALGVDDDPAASAASSSAHFRVFQLLQRGEQHRFVVAAVEIFSSKTGGWVLRESGWSERHELAGCGGGYAAYSNGFLHLCVAGSAVASVDAEGQTWRVSRVPRRHHHRHGGNGNLYGCLAHSQGRLLYVDDRAYGDDDEALAIFALDDHDGSEELTFKQSISKVDAFGPRDSRGGWSCRVVAFHPHGDLMFFYDWSQEKLLSYDMNHRVKQVVCTFGDVFNEHRMFLPYVPLYSGALAAPKIN
ncbi:hypothetical protein ACP4OV_003130 [Aristida adscensionis]